MWNLTFEYVQGVPKIVELCGQEMSTFLTNIQIQLFLNGDNLRKLLSACTKILQIACIFSKELVYWRISILNRRWKLFHRMLRLVDIMDNWTLLCRNLPTYNDLKPRKVRLNILIFNTIQFRLYRVYFIFALCFAIFFSFSVAD